MTGKSTEKILRERWLQVLVALQGIWLLAMGLSSDGAKLAVGVIGGALLIVAPFIARGPWWLYPALVAIGALPFAVWSWWAIIPLVVAVVAIVLALAFALEHRSLIAPADRAPEPA